MHLIKRRSIRALFYTMNSCINILIPFYNSEESLEGTIRTVIDQTSDEWKIIFVNDGSTDTSVQIVERFLKKNPGKGLLVHSDKPRSGPAVCRNLGLKYADADYLLCLDSDDQLAPFCVEQRLKVMLGNPQLDWAVFNQYQSSPGQRPPFPIFNKPVKSKEDCIRIFLGMDVAWQTMGPVWKVSALQQLGGFDPSLYPSEDPELHIRALLDDELQLKICADQPADCYYNVAYKTGEKLDLFYKESIESKIKLMQKLLVYLPTIATRKRLKVYHCYMRTGFYLFLRSFLLVRLKAYKKETWTLIGDLQKAGVLSGKDVRRLKMVTAIFTSGSPVVRMLRLKGIANNLLLPPAC